MGRVLRVTAIWIVMLTELVVFAATVIGLAWLVTRGWGWLT